MIVVLARTHAEAMSHLRELGIPPRSREVRILSTPQSTEGLRLTVDTRILCCKTFSQHRYAFEIMSMLKRCAARSAGREPGTRLELADIWEDIC